VLLVLTVATASAAAPHCAPGEEPQFVLGFAFLKSQLGDVMGEPLECEHPNPDNGDTLQQTSTGLAFYRLATNTPTFTDGWNHWAWTAAGMVQWAGAAVDPPGLLGAGYEPALIAEFRRLALGDRGYLIRWRGPIRVELRGSPTVSDVVAMDNLIAELGPLIAPVAISRVASGGNVPIYFIPRAQFINYIPGASAPDLAGAALTTFQQTSGIIVSGQVVISSGHVAAARAQILTHEMIHILGHTGHSDRPDSVLTAYLNGIGGWTPADIDLVRLLYHADVRPGMTAAELRAIGL
jgi:hypothetical protein